MDPERIGVVGGGQMGMAIAQLFVDAGFAVLLHSRRDDARRRFLEAAGRSGRRRAAAGRVTIAPAATADLAELRDCSVVIEAVTEELDAKRAVLRDVVRHAARDALLASTTSSLSIERLADGGAIDRLVGLHFFNPVRVVSVVELIALAQTRPTLTARAHALVERLGRRAIAVRDTAGFLVNRCLVPPLLEACRLLATSEATPAEIDGAYRSLGMIAGPCGIADLVGLDVTQAVCRHCADSLGPRFAPAPILAACVDAGRLGRKVGRGFFAYPRGRAEDDPAFARVRGPARGGSDAPAFVPPPPERLLVPLVNEALRCRAEGVARPVDIDVALRSVLGLPVGPLAYVDHMGLDAYRDRLNALDPDDGGRFSLDVRETPSPAGPSQGA